MAARVEGNGEGVPPLQPTRRVGERRKLPQWGPGEAPAENGFQCILSLRKNHLLGSNCMTHSLLVLNEKNLLAFAISRKRLSK